MSRCTSPAACTAPSPSASPAASARTEWAGSAPYRPTATSSDGPGRYSVASQGTAPSVSAPATVAVYRPLTRRAAATSRRNRVRNS